MTAEKALALQMKIHQSIPLSRALGFRIKRLDDSAIAVEAPLEPNINIHNTGFAGSIYSLGALSAWALGTHLTTEGELDAAVVIAEASIKYRAPIRETICCQCEVAADEKEIFLETLRAKGRARLEISVKIGAGPAASLQAQLHASVR